MKSITSRLNTFLAKIAGRDVDISTLTPPVAVNATEELLLEIADKVGALPDASEANDGDVLTVDDGEWKAAAPSGGSSVPDIEEGDTGKVLTASEDGAVWASGGGGDIVLIGENTETGAMTSTWQEIYDNFADGKLMLVRSHGDWGYAVSIIASVTVESDSYIVYTNNLEQAEGIYQWVTDSANGYPVVQD